MTEKQTAGLFYLETKTSKAWFDGQKVPMTPHWAYLFGLLILRRLEGGHQPVTVPDICRLPTWTAAQPKSVGNNVHRQVRKLNRLGFQLVTSPNREHTKRFVLDPTQVKQVGCDVKVPQLKAWLGLTQRDSVVGDPKVLMQIERARVYFEVGRFGEAKKSCEEVLQMDARMDDHLRALVLSAWITLQSEPKTKAKAAVERTQQALREFKAWGTEADQVSRVAEAGVWIHTARYHYLYREFRPAERAFSKAEPLLSPDDHREWSSIHAGRGYMARQRGDLDAGHQHHLLALQFASKACWRLGMVIQINNLGAVCMQRFQKLEDTDPTEAQRALEEAQKWCNDSLNLLNEVDLGGTAEQEFNLAFIELLLGNMKDAREWLKNGINHSNKPDAPHDKVVHTQLTAELDLAEGNREAAIAGYEKAIVDGMELEDQNWERLLRQRLYGIRTNSKKSKPLKLW